MIGLEIDSEGDWHYPKDLHKWKALHNLQMRQAVSHGYDFFGLYSYLFYTFMFICWIFRGKRRVNLYSCCQWHLTYEQKIEEYRISPSISICSSWYWFLMCILYFAYVFRSEGKVFKSSNPKKRDMHLSFADKSPLRYSCKFLVL